MGIGRSLRRDLFATALSTAAFVTAAPGAALAQGADDGAALQEVVVTARRVEERLQDVPLSITAMDSRTLEANRINKVQDLGAMVPNLITGKTSVPGAGTVAIRGVQGQGLPRPGLDNRVGVYIDGVYLARANGQSFGLADIERIEVLKGPQGTLFGRNVTAGSINIVTQAPSGQFGGVVEAGIGNYDRKRFRATFNMPEVAGFSARVTYLHEEEDGDVRNLAGGDLVGPINVNVPALPGNPALGTPASPAFSKATYYPKPAAGTLGGSELDSVFIAARYEGVENLVVDYKFDWNDQYETQPQQQIFGYSGLGGCPAAAIALGASLAQCGGVVGVVSTPGALTNVGGADGYFLSTGAQSYLFGNKKGKVAYDEFTAAAQIRSFGHNLTLNFTPTETLNFRSITAYRNLITRGQSGADAGAFSLNNTFLTATNPTLYPAALYPAGGVTAFPLGLAVTEQKQHQFSQEFQVFGPATDWLDYLVGAYYFRERTRYDQTVVNANVTSGAGLIAALNGVSGIPPYALNSGVNNYGIGAVGAGDASDVISKSKAIFGRLTFKPTEQLDIVLGARYTHDQKKSAIPQFMANFLDRDPVTPGQQPVFAELSQSFKKFTYDGTITYHFSDDMNVYARYATAYLAGGSLRNIPFDPETTKSAEIGFKSELFDRRVRFNTAAFWQKSKGYQFTYTVVGLPAPINTATAVRNLGSAEVQGFEAELTAVPIRGLTLNASTGYNHQKYKSPTPGLAPDHAISPEWTIQGAVQYDTAPVMGDAFLSFRLDANYRSSVDPLAVSIADTVGATGGALPAELLALYGLPNTAAGRVAYANMVDDFIKVGGFWTANARVTLEDIELGTAKARLSAYVRNIFNTVGKAQAANYGISVGGTWTPNRRYGVDLTVTF